MILSARNGLKKHWESRKFDSKLVKEVPSRMLSSKDITTPKGSIISLVNKLCEKIFYEKNCTNENDAVKVRFNGKICQHLRNIVFDRLIFNKQREEERNFTVKQRICVEGFKLRVRGLVDKAENLERLLSILGILYFYDSKSLKMLSLLWDYKS